MARTMEDVVSVERRRGAFYVVGVTPRGERHDIAGPLINEGVAYEIAGRLWAVVRTWLT